MERPHVRPQETVHVLLVEDEEEVAAQVERALSGCETQSGAVHYRVVHVRSMAEARAVVESWRPHMLFLDLTLPDADGIEAISELHEACDAPIIALTTVQNPLAFADALHQQAHDCLSKTHLDAASVSRAIRYAGERHRTRTLLRHSRQLLETNTRLQEATRHKDTFIEELGQQLKEPLTTLRGSLRAMFGPGSAPITDRQRDLQRSATRCVDRISTLLSDLTIDVKARAARWDQACVDVCLDTILEAAVDRAQNDARRRSIQVALDLPEQLPTTTADTAKLRDLFESVIGAAIHRAPDGSKIEIDTSVIQKDERPTFVVRVRDAGAGVTPSQMTALLGDAEPTSDRLPHITPEWKATGNALGLHAAQEIARWHEGELALSSAPGAGTEVSVYLPRLSHDDAAGLRVKNALWRAIRVRDSISVLRLHVRHVGTRPRSLLTSLETRVLSELHRTSDFVEVRPKHGDILVALPQTPKQGAMAVVRRLQSALTALARQHAPIPPISLPTDLGALRNDRQTRTNPDNSGSDGEQISSTSPPEVAIGCGGFPADGDSVSDIMSAAAEPLAVFRTQFAMR